MAISPTQNSLKKLRNEDWLPEVVERWNCHAKIRQDLYGFIDILAIKDNQTIAVQATSYSNVSERVKKIQRHDNYPKVKASGWIIQVWGWHKVKNRWQARIVDLSA